MKLILCYEIDLDKILYEYSTLATRCGVRQYTDISCLINFNSFTKHIFTFHSNRVKCEKQIFVPSVGFEPKTSCIRGKRLTARPQGPHNRERTTPRLI